jgi:hypothetical protein
MRKSLISLSVAAIAGLAFAVPAGARTHKSGIPTGYYQCYQTIQDVSPITGQVSYSTVFMHSFTLFGNGTYNAYPEGLFNRDNHWKFARGTLKFSSGPMWAGFRHAVGAYTKAGKPMPNSQLLPGRRYQLVLHDARTNDADTLPHHETAAASFWYCRKH